MEGNFCNKDPCIVLNIIILVLRYFFNSTNSFKNYGDVSLTFSGFSPKQNYITDTTDGFLQMHDLFPNVINDARIGIISTKVVNERTKYRSILFRNQKWTSIDTDKGATLNSVKGSRKRKGVSKQTPKQNGCTKEYYFKVFHLHIHIR